jgi:hypothetical protein
MVPQVEATVQPRMLVGIDQEHPFDDPQEVVVKDGSKFAQRRDAVGTIVGLVATGRSREEILREYPYLEADDIAEALSYAAWRAEEVEVPLASSEAAG